MRRFSSYWLRWHRLSKLPLERRLQSSLLPSLLLLSLSSTLQLPFLLQKLQLIQLKSWTHLRLRYLRFLSSPLLLLLLRLRFITLAELDVARRLSSQRYGGEWDQERESRRKMSGSEICRAIEELLQEPPFSKLITIS
jgi:hypothetical protein